MRIRIRTPKEPGVIRDIDLGPCLARANFYDAMRKRLDLALSQPRRVPMPVHLAQP